MLKHKKHPLIFKILPRIRPVELGDQSVIFTMEFGRNLRYHYAILRVKDLGVKYVTYVGQGKNLCRVGTAHLFFFIQGFSPAGEVPSALAQDRLLFRQKDPKPFPPVRVPSGKISLPCQIIWLGNSLCSNSPRPRGRFRAVAQPRPTRETQNKLINSYVMRHGNSFMKPIAFAIYDDEQRNHEDTS